MSGIIAVVRAWTVPAQGTGKVVQFIVTNGEVNFCQHSKRLGFAGSSVYPEQTAACGISLTVTVELLRASQMEKKNCGSVVSFSFHM